MNKEIAIILALAGLFVAYIVWRENVPSALAQIPTPAAIAPPADTGGPSYLVYNTGAVAGGYGFNPGPPVALATMPEMTTGLAGDCGCDGARSAGRF